MSRRSSRSFVAVLAAVATIIGLSVVQSASIATASAAAASRATAAASVASLAAATVRRATDGEPELPMPTEVPSNNTPWVDDNGVQKIIGVQDVMVAGGSFTSVSDPRDGTSYPRQFVFAFDATTGAVSRTFRPVLNGSVEEILAGPLPGTVYLGGAFTTVDGAAASHVVLLDVHTGARVPGFRAAATNGMVQTLALNGSRLYLGGYFSRAGGATHAGLASVNATSGALDPYVDLQLATRHNDTGNGATGPVGAREIAITPAGDRMAVVGNFKSVDGLVRDQVVMVSLSAQGAAVTPDWATTRYSPYCFNWAYDSYMRDLEMSSDGSFFVIAATGGQNWGSLCDAAARWETYATGTDLQPTWAAYSGGDTLWGVGITDAAVFVGGHNRWMNNTYGSDYANQGAVPRPGLSALDPATGVPLDWNPGRNPRGEAAYEVQPTEAGVWITSNTQWIGDRRYRRPRIAFFPYDGGTTVHPTSVGTLPGDVFIGDSAVGSNVLYRINTGGPGLTSLDRGPDWAADTDATSDYRNATSNAAGANDITDVTADVPASTPTQLFSSERWGYSRDDEMRWQFPVATGEEVQVRLYFANRCTCTSAAGSRVFNVSVDGQKSLLNYDIVADVGDQRGTMQEFDIVSDGVVDIDFQHVTENPLVNGIEIVRPGAPASDSDVVTSVGFNGTAVTSTEALPTPGLDWSTVRGATMIGDDVFYGSTDGYLYQRSFDGAAFGPAERIDPYRDPDWIGVDTGSNNTYDGVVPNWYGQLNDVTGMFFRSHRLYYTLRNDNALYWRSFVPDSGIVSPVTNTVTGGFAWSQAKGMFAAGASVFVVSSVNGSLNEVPFAGGAPSGDSTVVSSLKTGGIDWRGRALFLSTITPEPPNALPRASFTSACPQRTCSFDATASSDDDGTISTYSWSYGDDGVGSGVTPLHSYAKPGTYTVALTVEDDDGAQATSFRTVTITNAAPVAAFESTCTALTCSFDASGSSDTDGTVATYSWDFGDARTAGGIAPDHRYSGPGTYPVTLTVTDDEGVSSSITHDVTAVAEPAVDSIDHRATVSSSGSGTTASVVVPTTVKAGDRLVAILSLSTGTASATGPTGVTGWRPVGDNAAKTLTTAVWTTTADTSAAGARLRVPLTVRAKYTLTLAAYSGVSTASSVGYSAAADTKTKAVHMTPSLTSPNGAWALSYWADKSAKTVGWTVSDGPAVRRNAAMCGTGAGHVCSVVADSAGPTAASYGGIVATSSAAAAAATMWTIVLEPAS